MSREISRFREISRLGKISRFCEILNFRLGFPNFDEFSGFWVDRQTSVIFPDLGEISRFGQISRLGEISNF